VPQPYFISKEGNDLRKRVLTAASAFVLWLATSTVAVLEVVLIRDIAVYLYLTGQQGASSEESLYRATAIGTLVTGVVGVIVSVFVIWSGEYHSRHLGERRSWRTFAWIVTLEAAVFGLSLLVRWHWFSR
jgi:hypothetical protein